MKMDKKKLVYLCVGACVTTTFFPAIQVDAAGLSATSLNVGDQNTATGNYVATIGYKNKATGENSIVIGDNSQATGASSVAMGSEAKALAKNSFALGTKTTANGVSSVAFGNGTSTAAGATGATAFGYETKANAVSATAFGYQTEASGSNSTTFGNNTKASGEQSTAFGSETIADGKNATAFGYKTNAKGEDATAFGISTIASGTQATAFGLENIASAKSATAFGSNNTASGENSTVFGAENIASGSLSTVFGFQSKATSTQATAFGNSTEANGVVATAFGNESVANGLYATAFGNWTVANGTASTAFGAGSHAYGIKSTAFGSESRAHGENSLAALGGYTGANALNGVALGWGSKVEKADTYALGTLSTAHGEKGATAIGTSSLAAGDYTTAIGYQAGSQSTATMAPNDGAVRIDTNSLQKSNDSIFIGKNAGRDVLGADNVVIGNYNVADNAPGTNKGTFTGITAVGREAKVLSNKGVAVGYTSSVAANSESAIAIGDQASAKNAPKGIAIGKGAKAEAEDAISIGTGNTVSGAHSGAIGDPTTITGTGTYTIGNNNGIVAANNSGAFGNNNTFTGAINNVRIIGNNNTVTVDDAMILGNKSTVTGVAGVAIGTNAKANNANDVALGANSETTVAVGTPSASINGVTHNFAGIAPNSTVSVGKSGAERTITNVAAGRISATSTDAINGSQLFAVTEEINKGIVYAGDVKAAAAGANEFTQKLGEKTNIVGGVTNEADLTNNNIGVVSNGDDTLTVKLKKDVDLGANGSLKTGATTINNNGLTVGGNTYVTPNGINANNQKITNVANGTDPNDAVNYSQLQNAISGTAKASTVKAKDANVTVTEGTNAAGGKEFTVGLGNKITVGTAHPVTVDGDAGHVTGLTNTDWNVDNPQAVSGRGATEDQLKKVNDKVNTNKSAIDKNAGDINTNTQNITKNAGDIVNINKTLDKGLNFDGDSGAVINKKLGEKVSVKGGATGALSDGNIGVVSDGTGTLNVKLAKNLTGLESVTAGNTKIDNGGLTVGGKTYVSPTGINANDRKITNVADGDVAANSKDAVNGGQLHQVKEDLGNTITNTKNELNTNINNAKDEVINKGLRFDADNNSEKTNKLGSKVTVNGDNNITTEITQTGDDTKIGVTLNQDLNVKTLTATDTVKAGGVTVGKHADTKNYVTGLDNKDWDVNTSNPVSGRAATEDQLKKISEAIKTQGSASTDYRLIANPAVADGAYTVDSNGDVDLTVEDKNHAGQKETVKIKDVASKSGLDKLTDRAVKYDLDPAGNPDKSKVTYEGPTYANKAGGTHVTNVAYATGNDGSEAVNVDYLKDKIKDSEDTLTNKGLKFDANNGGEKTNKLGSKVTVKGDNSNIITEISQDGNGDSTIDVKLGKDLKTETITATGANGKDGKIGINGKDGVTTNISVTRDGQPGVDGAPGTTTTRIAYQKPDGTNEEVATLNDGLKFKGDMGATSNVKLNKQVNIMGGVTNAADLATGNNIGVTSAAVDADGNAKLQLQLAKNLTGLQSITASDTVKAGTVTMGKQTDGANPANTGNYVTGLDNKAWDIQNPTIVSGRAATEDQLKTVSDEVKKQGANATDYRLVKNAAEADGAYKVDDNGAIDLTVEDKNHPGQKETVKLKDIASKSKLDDVVAKGLQFDANSGGVQTNKLGSRITVQGEGKADDADYSGENIKTFIKQDAATGNTTIDVKMNKNLKAESVKVGKDGKDGVSITGPTGVAGQDGNNGKVGITGADGKDAVSMSGKDGVGHIGLTGPAGTNGVNGTNGIDMSVKNGYDDAAKGVKGANGVDGVDGITRIVYQDKNGEHQVATMDDGMLYGGDAGNVIKKKLNNQVNVKGGISDVSKLADEDNIGVVSDGSDTLKLRLAKDLKGLTSATFTTGGNTTAINGDGVKITNGPSITKNGIDAGGNKITNVADGVAGSDAVNKSQLDKAAAAASTTVSAGNNITVTPSTNANGSKNYEVSLKDKVTLGTDATKQIAIDGTAGTIKAGDKVEIDGNKGTIKAGNVTIDGENGTIKAGDKVTIDGKDGKIAAGKVSVDGKDGYVTGLENKDWDPNNITSGRAATEDQLQKSHKSLDNKITNLGDEITKKGMNFAGNTGQFHRDLGQKVTIKGEGTESDDKYSGENIKTVADQDGNVNIKMAKNLKTDSLTTDKVKVGKNGQDGVSITGPNGAEGTDGKVGITGKDGKDAVSMSGKDGVGHIGLTGKDGRNADITVDKGDPDLDGNNITRIKYQDENGKTHQVATKDDGMKYGGDSGSVIKKKLNEQVNVVGGITDASKLTTEDNLGVVSDGTGNLKVRMAKDLKGLETVTTKDAAGNTTVMNGGGVTITPAGGNAVSLTKDGLNNGGNTITNVGPGVNGTDAVNVNQLKGATDGLANAINSVAGETQRVGAHAAAMSALKPIQYDPLEPTQVMAGIGNYRGETAAALGVAHYTAEDTMFHVGVSVGSHHNMVNAGVTRKFGTSDAKKAVPERYKGGPISSMYVMQDEMTALKAENARMKAHDEQLTADYAALKEDNLRLQKDNEETKRQLDLIMSRLGL